MNSQLKNCINRFRIIRSSLRKNIEEEDHTEETVLGLLLIEYQEMRKEIIQREESAQKIIETTFVIITIAFAVYQILPNLDFFVNQNSIVRVGNLIFSLIFSSLTMVMVEHDSMIATISLYLRNKVIPAIQKRVSSNLKGENDVLGWDQFRYDFQVKRKSNLFLFGVMSAGRYAIPIIPDIIFIIVYFNTISETSEIKLLEWLLVGFTGICFLAVLVGVIFNANLYNLHSKNGFRIE